MALFAVLGSSVGQPVAVFAGRAWQAIILRFGTGEGRIGAGWADWDLA